MKQKLNKTNIDAATYDGPGGDYRWDTELAGFGVRIYPSGRKSFVTTYRVHGRQRFHTLGRYGEMTVQQARAEALEVLAKARKGEDIGGAKLARRKAPTVADLAERYMEEYAAANKKARTIKRDRRAWDRLILPALGRRKVVDIVRADIAKLHSSLSTTPAMANNVRSVLSTAFNLAEVWGWRKEGTNPCRHVKRYKEEGRDRFLSERELSRLGATLDELEQTTAISPHSLAAVRLLALTGCRPEEILSLQWKFVDFERNCLRLPDSKTGKKTVYLSTAAVQVLAGIERVDGNPYVIPGAKPGTYRKSLQAVWKRIQKAAQLEDVRLYDLRHTFASTGVNAGLSIKLVGTLLGHSKVATTERYAHVAAEPVRKVNEQIGATLAATMAGKPKAKVVEMGER